LRFLFVMDPAERMLPDRDTSFALMRAAGARGHECWHCLPHQVGARGADPFARARRITVSDTAPHVIWGEHAILDLAAVDAVFVRKDPPFDVEYLHLTQLLDLVQGRTLVVNDPRGLRDANEKLFALWFADLMPRTLVSSDPARLLDFVIEVGGRAVLKPLDGAGGRGVVVVGTSDPNARSLVDLHTGEGTRPAIIQAYLPAAREGDKRVIVLDGAPLGAILRVPRSDDFRANLHVGGEARATTLTDRERDLVRVVGEALRKHGLWLVGLDLIGERLIEVNVTSPTGVQELGRLTGTVPELDVIEWVERRLGT
jgi:glutathione synthase